jgi:glutaredoxin 3
MYNEVGGEAMAEKKVKVYSTPTCPWCKKTKLLLDGHGVKYQEFNVIEDTAARDEMVNLTHQLSVPTIVVGDDFVIGYDEKALKEKLDIQ